ncbi:MAG: outer membrane beta-barrel protein [Pseudomonadota bacterium]
MRALLATAAAVLIATPALADGDWTGGYVGGQLGYLDVDGTGAADGDDIAYGVHGGYDFDFGEFVVGGEIEWDWTDVDLGGAADVDSVGRLKVKAGYDLGNVLPYVTVGVAEVDTSLGDDTGGVYGLGVAYRLTDEWTISGEALYHDFNNIEGTGVDAEATSVNVRASFRF